jgi:hypothetical protein
MVDPLFERQARWQKNRARLSWPEKVRLAEAVRESLERFRQATSHGKRSIADQAPDSTRSSKY